MGRFERELDESIARYEARRRKAEQLYEEERTAAQLGEDLEPQEESTRRFSIPSLLGGLILLLVVGVVISSLLPSIMSGIDQVADAGNMTGQQRNIVKGIPMLALLVPVFAAIGFVGNQLTGTFEGEVDYEEEEEGEVVEEEEAEFIVKGKVIRRTSQ